MKIPRLLQDKEIDIHTVQCHFTLGLSSAMLDSCNAIDPGQRFLSWWPIFLHNRLIFAKNNIIPFTQSIAL
ncbi:MAG: hypothetical protein D3917_08645 [Candidatus Electrothrix sp. AX5]|nr:hypothetical protein [Candidatus Electrothrix sp. AX5]